MAVLRRAVLELLQTGGLLRSLEHAGSFLGLERVYLEWPAGGTPGGGQAGQPKQRLAKPPQARSWPDLFLPPHPLPSEPHTRHSTAVIHLL